MVTLNNILKPLQPVSVTGNTDIVISGLTTDSRKAAPGIAFIALRGTSSDGHDFIEAAVKAGAAAVVSETAVQHANDGVTYVQVKDSALAAGLMAAKFYGDPSAGMNVIGVTGTNGKTTTATLLYQLFKGLGFRCGLVSTVRNFIDGAGEPSTHTTPEAIALQALFAKMAAAACTYVFMEVSSHAIHQQRIAGTHFTGGIFTNITHDHLDYHKTFDEYIRVKKLFFDNLPDTAFAVTNIDDKRGAVMLQNTRARKISYSLQSPADVKGKLIENSLAGLSMYVDGIETHFRMTGMFNAYNLLAVYGAAIELYPGKHEVLSVLSGLRGAPGRFETLTSRELHILGIVDYAHTPDALLNVLATINQLRSGNTRLITVAGCGGDRDKTKRPLMAEVACTHSDRVILTSDNPRTENPEEILDDMERGLAASLRRKVLRVTLRAEAIKTACSLAGAGDVILVAGKGHENYQEINGVRHHFDDKEELLKAFELYNL